VTTLRYQKHYNLTIHNYQLFKNLFCSSHSSRLRRILRLRLARPYLMSAARLRLALRLYLTIFLKSVKLSSLEIVSAFC
jgi:hypothetical protein